jgi:hypothetical protein
MRQKAERGLPFGFDDAWTPRGSSDLLVHLPRGRHVRPRRVLVQNGGAARSVPRADRCHGNRRARRRPARRRSSGIHGRRNLSARRHAESIVAGRAFRKIPGRVVRPRSVRRPRGIVLLKKGAPGAHCAQREQANMPEMFRRRTHGALAVTSASASYWSNSHSQRKAGWLGGFRNLGVDTAPTSGPPFGVQKVLTPRFP